MSRDPLRDGGASSTAMLFSNSAKFLTRKISGNWGDQEGRWGLQALLKMPGTTAEAP
jgi:hypothetical protein